MQCQYGLSTPGSDKNRTVGLQMTVPFDDRFGLRLGEWDCGISSDAGTVRLTIPTLGDVDHSCVTNVKPVTETELATIERC